MSCDEALPLLYDLVDGDIGRDDAVALARHLASCSACARALGSIDAAEAMYAERTAVAPPQDLAARIAGAVAQARPELGGGSRTWLLAVLAAAAVAATALLAGQGAIAWPAEAAARLGAGAVEWASGVSWSLAHSWSAWTAWLAAPAVLGGGVILFAALIVLQIGGSVVLLSARRREGPR